MQESHLWNIEYADNYLMHYGMPGKSGRYPLGSGARPYQHRGGGGGISRVISSVRNKFSVKGRAARAESRYKTKTANSKALIKRENAKNKAIRSEYELANKKSENKQLKRDNKQIRIAYKNTAKNSSRLTDEQLDSQIRRLEKEKRLKDLTKEITQTKTSAGKKYVGDIMKSAGKTVLTTAAIGVGTYALNKALTGSAKYSKNPNTAKVLNEIAEAATKKKK